MLQSIAITLGFQALGEFINRFLNIPIPGPVIGMVLLLAAFFLDDRLIERIRPTAGVLLANLSLLFVPAGVGIIRHGERFLTEGIAITFTIIITGIIVMAVTVLVTKGIERLMNLSEAEED